MVDVSAPLIVPTVPDVPANNEASNVGGTGLQPVGSKPAKPRGRPKASSDGNEAPKRGRGRPKKTESAPGAAKEKKSETIEILTESLRRAGELPPSFPDDPLNFDDASGAASKSGGESIPKVKRARGRPRKNPDQPPKPRPPKDGPKRGRGRPRKNENKSVGRPRKRPLDEAVESPSKQPRTNGDDLVADLEAIEAADPTFAGSDSADTKKKPGRPKKDGESSTNAQNGTSDSTGVKKRGKNPSAKGPGRPRGRPKKAAQSATETTDGEPQAGKLQVSFSDSESEESEALGKGVKQSGIFPAFSEPQASEAASASSGVPLHPTAREPGLLNKFDESFDEDSDN